MTDTRLTEDQITAELADSSWSREGEAIVREVELDDFAGAIGALNKVAGVAEEHNHHPDILIHGWNKLRLTVSTHSAGGLTAADFALARAIDPLL